MIKAVATVVEPAERAAGQAPVQSLYLEALTLVERLHRRRALSEARQDRGTGRRHLERGVRDPEQVAAPARAVLDRPDPVSALRLSRPTTNRPSRRFEKTGSHQKDNFPKRIDPVFGPV